MTATSGTIRRPMISAAAVAQTVAPMAPSSSCAAPTPNRSAWPAVAEVAAAVPVPTDVSPATTAAPESPTVRDSRPAATCAATVPPASTSVIGIHGGPASSSARQATVANNPVAPSATARPAAGGHPEGSCRTVSATAAATSSQTAAPALGSTPTRNSVAPSITPAAASVDSPSGIRPTAVRRIQPPCAIALSRNDCGHRSRTVSSASANVDWSGRVTSMRDVTVRTLSRTRWPQASEAGVARAGWARSVSRPVSVDRSTMAVSCSLPPRGSPGRSTETPFLGRASG